MRRGLPGGELNDSVGLSIEEEKRSGSDIAAGGWIVSDGRRTYGGTRQTGLEWPGALGKVGSR